MTTRSIWVFAGPSLPPARRPSVDGVIWRSPAVAGDGLEALEARPRAVVLIDGLFDQHPAIRHKELLTLIAGGVTVIGGASMGALRAAEMRSCGMIGIGRIFEAYASGWLVGDDEVAVLHGPADMDWAPLSVPLVNVRATLLRALRERIVAPATARRLRERARAIFYQDRTWRTVLEAASRDTPAAELRRFGQWVGRGYFDLKQADARACLAAAMADVRGVPMMRPLRRTVFTDALARDVRSGRKPALAVP